MTKKVIETPRIAVLPNFPDTNAAGAAANVWVDLRPTCTGFNIEDSADEIESSTSEDDGFKSFLAGLRDFNATLMWLGGDFARDYALVSAFHRRQSVFVCMTSKGAISAEWPAWVFSGRTFNLPQNLAINETPRLEVPVRPSGVIKTGLGGVRYVTSPTDITGSSAGQLGLTNAPIAAV